MPARFTSQRGSLAVMRSLIFCFEDDIPEYARQCNFPILPCHLCSNQANLHRPQVKLLLTTLQSSLHTDATKNLLHACHDVRPSHLLDQSLQKACGMNPITGQWNSDSSVDNDHATREEVDDDDDDDL